MAHNYSQKAPFNDWWYWSECLVKRFKTISDLYKENAISPEDRERALLTDEWSKKLKDNCKGVVDEMRKGLKTDEQKKKVKELEEEAIFKCAGYFRDLLLELPLISKTVQDFLGVYWEDCRWEDPSQKVEELDENGIVIKKKKKGTRDGRVMEVFWGPKARQDEGIRSGEVQDGGLPGIMANLLMAEKSSSNRAPTDYGQVMAHAASQAGLATSANNAAQQGLQFKPGGSI